MKLITDIPIDLVKRIAKGTGEFVLRERFKNGRLGDPIKARNGWCTAGINKMLDRMFDGAAQTSVWNFGVISATSYTTGIVAADTYTSHAGWVEFTDYDEAVRQTWQKNAASGGIKSNTTPGVITITTGGTDMKGLFLADDTTKGETTGSGVIFCHGLFAANVVTVAAQVYNLFYTTTLQPG